MRQDGVTIALDFSLLAMGFFLGLATSAMFLDVTIQMFCSVYPFHLFPMISLVIMRALSLLFTFLPHFFPISEWCNGRGAQLR